MSPRRGDTKKKKKPVRGRDERTDECDCEGAPSEGSTKVCHEEEEEEEERGVKGGGKPD